MKIRLTKKGKIILFVIVGIIVLGFGGFLLWRVLQEETVAPEGSDAGGGGGSCCCFDKAKGCSGCSYSCKEGTICKREGINLGACDIDQGCGVCQTVRQGCFWSSEMGSTGTNNFYGCDGKYFKINPDSGLCYCGGKYNGLACWKESDQCKCASTCDSGPVKTCAQTKECEFPLNAYYDSDTRTCSCVRWDKQSHKYGLGTYCTTKPLQCSLPITCKSKGMEDCGISGDGNDKTGCVVVDTCNSWCGGCGNLSVYKRYCKPKPTEQNICEGSKWISKPSGEYKNCVGKKASVEATDPDGIEKDSISVKVNGKTKTGYETASTTSGTSITYNFLSTDCTQPGEYTISFTWKDAKGNSGPDCTLSTTFTIVEEDKPYCGDGIKQSNEICDPKATGADAQCVNNLGEIVACAEDCTCPDSQELYCGDGILTDDEECELGNPTGYTCLWDTCNQTTCKCPEEQQNPDWNIVKSATETCIVENEKTYAKAIYNIKITNIGEGEGSIDKVVDDLDDKVLETYLNDISNTGVYASGLITWDLQGEEEIFSPNESMEFTYYIKVPAEVFGSYANTATAYPKEGENFSDSESVDLDCDIPEEEKEIPQTGIFDSIVSKIALGILFILIGANWNGITKVNYAINEYVSDRRIKKFERKIGKR